MFVSKIKKRYVKTRKTRFCQGDIIQNINFSLNNDGEGGSLEFSIIMNQDCDMDEDHKARKTKKYDKYLPYILLCPAYKSSELCSGTHINGWTMNNMLSKSELENNDKLKRYHLLKADTENSIPELVVDFKHFFTLPTDFLYKNYKKNYIATINELFRESLSQRFSYFLSRIGLPEVR